MKRIYVPAGKAYMYNGIALEAVPTQFNAPTCTGCYFSRYYCQRQKLKEVSCVTHGLMCTKFMRQDKKHVIFVKIVM